MVLPKCSSHTSLVADSLRILSSGLEGAQLRQLHGYVSVVWRCVPQCIEMYNQRWGRIFCWWFLLAEAWNFWLGWMINKRCGFCMCNFWCKLVFRCELYIYIPGSCLSAIFGLQPSKTKPFAIKKGWFGFQIGICGHYSSLPNHWCLTWVSVWFDLLVNFKCIHDHQ